MYNLYVMLSMSLDKQLEINFRTDIPFFAFIIDSLPCLAKERRSSR